MIKRVWKQYRSMSNVTKAALWFAFASVLQKGISFFTVPIFTRIMTPEQYGLFNVYLSWVSVLTIIGGMEFQSCVYINGLAKFDNEKDKDELAISLLNLAMIITSAWVVIYLFFRNIINEYVGLSTKMIALMFIEVFFAPAINLWTMKQRYTYHYKTLVMRTIGQVFLNAILGIMFVVKVQEKNQAFARVAAIQVVQVVFGVSMLIWFITKARSIFSTKYWKKALELHIPLLPHKLSLSVLASADRIMISNMVSASATAIYSVAYSATMVISIIKLAINDALTPWIYDSIKNHKYESIKTNSTFVMLLVMVMSFLFILFAPEVIWIVGSKTYMEAIYVMPPVAASVFFTFLYNLFSSVEFYYERTREVMIASISAAVVNVILNSIFIEKYGYIAAGYTTLICYILLSIVHYIVMTRIISEKLEKKELFDNKMIVILSIVTIIGTMVCTILYAHSIWRYIVIITIFIWGFFKKRSIVCVIKQVKNKR